MLMLFNLETHDTGDGATDDRHARNNLESFHHIIVEELIGCQMV